MQVATVFALIWAGLCIGSANLMINDFGIVAKLYSDDPVQAKTVWSALEAVENGIVSGNEIIGSLWVLLLSLAALRTGELTRRLNHLGIALGAAGIFTSLLSFVFPETKDLIMIFGLGMIPWSIWVGIVMLRTSPDLGRKTCSFRRNSYQSREGHDDESHCIHQIRTTGGTSTQRGGKTYSQRTMKS